MKYDIFISYRRKESSGRSNVPMARTFKLEFERRGYKVFFDYSDCTDNYFSETILPAAQTCDYFVLILTEDSISRCFNEGDWVRREIEEALANNRKIIPITPDNECCAWPELPDTLKKLDGLQITTIHTDHMFEASVDFLVKNRFHLTNDYLMGNKDRKAEHERVEAESLTKEASEKKRLAEERRIEEERQKTEHERTVAKEKQNNTGQEQTNVFNDHEYVDLGLPSGTLWATCNVGANKPENYGNYFSWDEGKTAVANWGNDWVMPSKEQWEELIENMDSIWTKRNGVNGRLFMANNGNSLFLPAAGHRLGNSLNLSGSYGRYWSSSLYIDGSRGAWYFYFDSGCEYMDDSGHLFGYGRSVRPVRPAK